MKIAIDIRPLSDQNTGVGRYLDKLLESLLSLDSQNQYLLFYNALKGASPRRVSPHGNARVVSSRWPNALLHKLWARTSFPSLELLIGSIDVFHGPAFLMPPAKRAASVLTIHDLVFIKSPELASPKAVKGFARWICRFAERADIIVADSNATARDIADHLNIDSQKIAVVYPGATLIPVVESARIASLKEKIGISGDYLLFVGTIEPRKNLSRLIQAYDRSDIAGRYKLVFAGPMGWNYDGIIETWQASINGDNIHFLNYISEEELFALYNGSFAFVFPSLMEGFGLPILEAMSVGCPVLTSNVSSMPEVAGDAAVYVEPYDIESIKVGLNRICTDNDLRIKLSIAGRERVAKFSWENAARQMITIYEKANKIKLENI